MKSLITWSVRNTQAMNVCLIAILSLGAWSLSQLRRDFWPDFELYRITVTVVYPGASPDEVEEGILEKIEESIHTVDGVEEMTSVAREGVGTVMLELDEDTTEADSQRILSEVKTLIDQIPSFPELAEKPDTRIETNFVTAIRVAILGRPDSSPEAALELRRVAESIRGNVLSLPEVSVADFQGVPDFEIDIEIPEPTLRQYNLSLSDVATLVRNNNVELPSGTLKSRSQEILLRGSGKSEISDDIAAIPLVTQPGGAVLTVGDLGIVRDEFSDEATINEINGRPAVILSVETTSADDLVLVADSVRKFVDDRNPTMPEGYSLMHMRDRSETVKDRLNLLTKNGWAGLILVFITLALFLEMRLAWWVAMGIPVSFLGACIYMNQTGQTLNMTSMFAFLIALGIVVDDAIVVGENIYTHREMGKSYTQAAIDGTYEVMPSVLTAVATTIIAFLPIMYMEGEIKRMTVVLPVCVSAMLIISLIECVTLLPSHLSHQRSLFFDVVAYILFPLRPLYWLIQKANAATQWTLERFVERVYLPTLRLSLRNPAIIVSLAAGLLILSIGTVRSGVVPFLLLPKLDFGFITCQITYPNGTPVDVTSAATRRLEDAIWAVNRRAYQEGLTTNPDGFVTVVQRSVGAAADGGGAPGGTHVGGVFVQLNALEDRTVSAAEIVAMWREEAGGFPGSESVGFGATPRGPAALPISLRLMASSENLDQMDAAIVRIQDKLAEYPYVSDIATDTRLGKWEYRMKVRDDARAMGVSLTDVARTVRASYYGEEVMRLQRGRHEVQLRVRYPREDRQTLASFRDIRVRNGDGMERPLSEIAEVDVQRGFSEISRVNQRRAVAVVADVDEDRGNAFNVVADMRENFIPGLEREFPGVRFKWEGQQEQTTESINSLTIGFVVVLGAMFLLLTIQFGSSSQAILILFIIPFGFIGAIAGHMIMGFELTLFSIFGIVALSGVVVNDSIVLVDFINRRRSEGAGLEEALIDAGRRRFRAVLLTSLTTIAGMAPIILERSKQAQVVAPMATSLTFGLALTTVLVLILTPVMYMLSAKIPSVDVNH